MVDLEGGAVSYERGTPVSLAGAEQVDLRRRLTCGVSLIIARILTCGLTLIIARMLTCGLSLVTGVTQN